MDIRAQAVRSFRLRAHHLDKMLPSGQIETAAGACGVQNSPPGAWETALFNRVEGCTLPELHDALYRRKTLLQAWSYRGVPVVFPTAESGIFLSPLAALKGEAPWIYTRGIALALEHLQMSFDSLLPLVKQAAGYLDAHTVQGKETLDRVLADAVREHLPSEKRTLWDAPSMYGAPDRQTVGGAAVSFLLRPCSFSGLVVFGCRRDVLLPDKALQKLVWRTVGNPGAVVLDGRISGMWTARTVRDRLELSVTAWQAFSARQQSMLEIRAQEYAAFRGLSLLKYTLEDG